MKKQTLLFIYFIFSLNLFAQTIEAKYNISYGDFLDLGIATTSLHIQNNEYKITMKAQTTGMAKLLSNNREERYESYGKVLNNEFIPSKFIKIKKNNLKQRIRTYTFDHKNKKVFLNDKRTGKKNTVNQSLERITVNINEEKNSILDYYANNDILSLFFNMREKLLKYKIGEEYSLNAVGANKTKGIINILMPSEEKLKEMNKVLKTDDKSKFTAYINQKIFQSQRGELLISLNNYGFCSYTVLKDVLLFGDIVGKMVEFKIQKG